MMKRMLVQCKDVMLRALLAGIFLLSSEVGWAQVDVLLPDSSSNAVTLRVQQFIDDLKTLEKDCHDVIMIKDASQLQESQVSAYEWRIKSMDEKLQTFNSCWNTYFIAQQYEIAAHDDLMERVAQLDVLKQAVTDSIAARKNDCAALRDFLASEAFIMPLDTTYKRLYSRASKLSLIAKAAPMLEKLKASEQMTFADVSAHYTKAKEAVGLMPVLAPRMAALDEKYISLKAMSEKIQAMAYKPFIQRIKDYLLGFAAVAILLLFFNLLVSRLMAVKKAYKSMKQYKNLLKTNEQENYPTI